MQFPWQEKAQKPSPLVICHISLLFGRLGGDAGAGGGEGRGSGIATKVYSDAMLSELMKTSTSMSIAAQPDAETVRNARYGRWFVSRRADALMTNGRNA